MTVGKIYVKKNRTYTSRQKVSGASSHFSLEVFLQDSGRLEVAGGGGPYGVGALLKFCIPKGVTKFSQGRRRLLAGHLNMFSFLVPA